MWILEGSSIVGLFLLASTQVYEIIYRKRFECVLSLVPWPLFFASVARHPISIAIVFGVSMSHIQTAFVAIYSIYTPASHFNCFYDIALAVVLHPEDATLCSSLTHSA
jgi:hypothetical protein